MVAVVRIFQSRGVISGLCWTHVDVIIKSVFILRGYVFICNFFWCMFCVMDSLFVTSLSLSPFLNCYFSVIVFVYRLRKIGPTEFGFDAPVVTCISLPNAVDSYLILFYFIQVVYWISELLFSLMIAYI
jgi:hypothetical protein